MKKFEQIANEVERDIRDGILVVGEKVTSVREMSQKCGVSINTILAAYELLERKGLLTTKPQSGYYVLGRPEEKMLGRQWERRSP